MPYLKSRTKDYAVLEALVNGETLSPLNAWDRWRMANTSFNRRIWQLKHLFNLVIVSERMVTDESSYKKHTIPEGFRNEYRHLLSSN